MPLQVLNNGDSNMAKHHLEEDELWVRKESAGRVEGRGVRSKTT